MNINVCMLTFTMPPEHSGAAKQAITLASKLSEFGVRSFFITQGCYLKNLTINRVSGFRVVRIYKETLFWKILAPLRFFYALFKDRRNFSIIHVHGMGYIGKIAVIFGMLYDKKVLLKMTMFSEDDAMSIKTGPHGRINFWFFSKASHYIAITSSFYNSCKEAGIPDTKVTLIPNGVDTDKFTPISLKQKQVLRSKLGLPGDKKILVYAGIIRPEKGIDFLLDTIEYLSKSNSNTFLLLLGPIETWLPKTEQMYVSEVLRRINVLTKEERVFYAGNVDNVNEYFHASDVFVSASYKEGLQNVLIEAMSSGLPPVVINIPDMHKVVLKNSVNGIIVQERDVAEFSKQIGYLLENDDLYNSISESARKTVEENYSIYSVAKRYLNLYDNLLG